MRWDKMRESQNVEEAGSGSSGQGGGLRLGLGGIAVVLVLGLLLGKSPMQILGLLTQLQSGSVGQTSPVARPIDNKSHEFVARILGDTEDTWQQIYQEHGQQYQLPKLVSFHGAIKSACGHASAAMGPFYCPADQKVYLDYAFFDELHRKFGAPGDFAQAYVIAHEVGHHVQNLMGLSAKVQHQQQRLNQAQSNALSVRLELQADCFAGVWGYSAARRGLLDAGDMDEALVAANAIGDDTLQKNAGHAVVPDAFTHGSSEQRMRWFKRGMENGDIKACNTFDSHVVL